MGPHGAEVFQFGEAELGQASAVWRQSRAPLSQTHAGSDGDPARRRRTVTPIDARLRGGPQTRIRSANPAQVDIGNDALHRRSLRSVVRFGKLAGTPFNR